MQVTTFSVGKCNFGVANKLACQIQYKGSLNLFKTFIVTISIASTWSLNVFINDFPLLCSKKEIGRAIGF